jgi:hypothetical protein
MHSGQFLKIALYARSGGVFAGARFLPHSWEHRDRLSDRVDEHQLCRILPEPFVADCLKHKSGESKKM